MANSERRLSKDIERIRGISLGISKRLSEIKPSEQDKIEKLSLEELQDLEKIVGIADFILCKYAEKKKIHATLKEFVSIISETAKSLDGLDDDISEMILSAEDSIGKVKDIHVRISNKSDLKETHHDGPEYSKRETCPINLTNFATEVNIAEYQQNHQRDTA